MADRILDVIESPISHQRQDGRYSFRMQGRDDDGYKGPGIFAWPDGYAEEVGWRPPGPYVGVYDSVETANGRQWERWIGLFPLKAEIDESISRQVASSDLWRGRGSGADQR